MIDKILNFIVDYCYNILNLESYLNIIDRTKLIYNRQFTHKIYLNLAHETLKEMRY